MLANGATWSRPVIELALRRLLHWLRNLQRRIVTARPV
jgi:hypothetical protein